VSQKSKELMEVEANNLAANNNNLVTTIFEIDRQYQEQISHFMTQLHTINSDIESLDKEIELIKESIKEKEKELESLTNSVSSELLYLEKLNEKLISKINVAIEMKKIDNFTQNYKDALDELSEEIRELEIDILQKELQKENLQLKLMPSWQKITDLKNKLNKLKTKKRYIESLGLQKNSNISEKKEIPTEVVDVEVQ